MLKTLGDILSAFIEQEKKILEKADVKHRSTLGSMYEDLTSELLGRALPRDLPLQVVSGFIVKDDGSDSPEMDIMLVSGDVTSVPRSPKVRCKMKDVIAVIQSKKTLNKAMVKEGLDNLWAVKQIKPAGNVSVEQVRKNYESIVQSPLPGDLAALPPVQKMVYHQLVVAAAMPVCILLSYGGYSTHEGFRTGIIQSLAERLKSGGPMGLPDLILNQNFAMVKMMGLPWSVPLDKNQWPLLATSNMSPTTYFMLESIYSKLVLRGLENDEVFGEDLEKDAMTLLAKFEFLPEKDAWRVGTFENIKLDESHNVAARWEPVFLTASQYKFIVKLCDHGYLIIENLAAEGLLDADILYLRENGLVGQDIQDHRRFQLLTASCGYGVLSDGRFFAGENNSGRTIRWADSFDRDWQSSRGEDTEAN